MSNNNNKRFETLDAAIDTYRTADSVRTQIENELKTQQEYMSAICQAMLSQFGVPDDKGKLGLVIDVGVGNPRGYIVSHNGDNFFIRGRNSGRPLGSKNRNGTKAERAAKEREELRALAVETIVEPAPRLLAASNNIECVSELISLDNTNIIQNVLE
jgi:hypothetical protein